jgi:cytochrome bd ubiquinol oxidase subunit II
VTLPDTAVNNTVLAASRTSLAVGALLLLPSLWWLLRTFQRDEQNRQKG